MKAILIRDEIHELITADNISQFVEMLICSNLEKDFLPRKSPGRKSLIDWKTKSRLFDAYNKHNHTQKEISERYNLSIPTINKIVNKNIHPSVEHFRSLGIEVDYSEWEKENKY